MYPIKINCEHWANYVDRQLFFKKPVRLYIDATLFERDGVLIDPYTQRPFVKNDNEITIFLQLESKYILGSILQRLIDNPKMFDYILAFEDQLKDHSIFFQSYLNYSLCKFPFGENLFLKNKGILGTQEYTDKEFYFTMIIGHKRYCPGHHLRQGIWERQEELNIPKKFYYGQQHDGMKIFEGNQEAPHRHNKSDMYKGVMFDIVVENNRSKNYFTEKINDCIVTKTIPIYWGCPNIEDFYDTRGIIIFEDFDDLKEKLSRITPQTYYDMLPYVEINYQKFVNETKFADRFEKIVNSLLESD